MKILVIDDHPLILDALREILPQLASGVVVRAAAHAGEAIAILDDEPDVALVLLDLALPGTRGLDLLADFLLDYPGVPVVVLSATHDDATVNAALGAGARGFIAKTAEPRGAARSAAAGARGICLSSRRRRRCRRHRRRAHRRDRAGTDGAPGRRAAAARAGQAQQAHLPRPPPVRGHRQGPRQRDPEGAARRIAHAGGGRTRAAGHPRRPPPAAPADRCPPAPRPTAPCRRCSSAPSPTRWRRCSRRGGARRCRCCWARSSSASCWATRRRPRAWPHGLRRSSPTRRGAPRSPAPTAARDRRRRWHRAGDGAGHWARSSRVRCGAWPPSPVYPAPPAHQALLIVCLFGVALGGVNLTAVYRPAFYAFVLPALVPLIVRVARGRRRSPPRDCGGDDGRARVPARVRHRGQRTHHPLADDPPREHRPHRRTQDADRCRRGGADRCREREPGQEPVPGSRQPRPAPAAARAGPVRGGACRSGCATRIYGRWSRASTRRSRRWSGCSPSSSTSRDSRPAHCTPVPTPASARAAVRAPRRRLRSRRRTPRASRCGCGTTTARGGIRPGAAGAHAAQPRRATRCATRAQGGVLVARPQARRRRAHRRRRHRRRHRRRGPGARVRRLRPGLRQSASPRRRPRHGAGALDRPAPRRAPATPRGARLDARPRLALLDRAAAGGPRRRRRPAGHRGCPRRPPRPRRTLPGAAWSCSTTTRQFSPACAR